MVRGIWWIILKALIKTSFSSKIEAGLSGSSKLLKFYQKRPNPTTNPKKGAMGDSNSYILSFVNGYVVLILEQEQLPVTDY